jgi:hypothetical protein
VLSVLSVLAGVGGGGEDLIEGLIEKLIEKLIERLMEDLIKAKNTD